MCGDVSLVILAREKEKKIHFMRKEYDFSLELKKKKKKEEKKKHRLYSLFFFIILLGGKKKRKNANTCHKKVILLSRAPLLN